MTDLDANLSRLGDIAMEMASSHRELAILLCAEREAKVTTWAASQETSIQGRDRHADANALHLTQDIFRLKADLSALGEERDHLRLLVHVDLERKATSDSLRPSTPEDQ